MESEGYPRAEEVLRLLAAAAYSARLYPPSSLLPGEAAKAFAARANGIAGLTGPLRYTVDPKGFRLGDVELAAGQSQIVAFAESLHALQVGQLIIAPGVSADEARSFVEVANADPRVGARTGRRPVDAGRARRRAPRGHRGDACARPRRRACWAWT